MLGYVELPRAKPIAEKQPELKLYISNARILGLTKVSAKNWVI